MDYGLKDTEYGFGIQPTYPVNRPWSWLKRIPIDHCLVSSRFVALNRETGPSVNSDHYPLLVELGLMPDAVKK